MLRRARLLAGALALWALALPPAAAAADIPSRMGCGSFFMTDWRTRDRVKYEILNTVGFGLARLEIYPHNFWDRAAARPTPERLDEAVLLAHRHGIQPIAYFHCFGNYLPDSGLPIGDRAQWQAIGQAFAERFAPDSPWLVGQGIRGWGIAHYQAFNEPDHMGRESRQTGQPCAIEPKAYHDALQGLGEGVHGIGPRLRVYPAGYAYQDQAVRLGYVGAVADQPREHLADELPRAHARLSTDPLRGGALLLGQSAIQLAIVPDVRSAVGRRAQFVQMHMVLVPGRPGANRAQHVRHPRRTAELDHARVDHDGDGAVGVDERLCQPGVWPPIPTIALVPVLGQVSADVDFVGQLHAPRTDHLSSDVHSAPDRRVNRVASDAESSSPSCVFGCFHRRQLDMRRELAPLSAPGHHVVDLSAGQRQPLLTRGRYSRLLHVRRAQTVSRPVPFDCAALAQLAAPEGEVAPGRPGRDVQLRVLIRVADEVAVLLERVLQVGFIAGNEPVDRADLVVADAGPEAVAVDVRGGV